MKNTYYKGYFVTTEENNSRIYKNDELVGCTTSDVKYDEENTPIYNSEAKAKARIDNGRVNILKA